MNYRAGAARIALAAMLAVSGGGWALAAELPAGFGDIFVGASWDAISEKYPGADIEQPITDWDRYVRDCGHRYLRIKADKGTLLVTLNDSRVTEVAYVTAIAPDSDVLGVASLVMRSYGEPERATMRDRFGQITIDRAAANSVRLDYRRPRPVEFSVSGAPLWEYRIVVSDPQHLWYENKTLRCARTREREAAKSESAAKKSG